MTQKVSNKNKDHIAIALFSHCIHTIRELCLLYWWLTIQYRKWLSTRFNLKRQWKLVIGAGNWSFHWPILVWGDITFENRTPLHVFDAGTTTEKRYKVQVLGPHARLFEPSAGRDFILWIIMCGQTTTCWPFSWRKRYSLY